MSGSSSSKLPLSTPLLPRLPVELLRKIVESSVPSYYHSLTYDDRQTTLRNLCLTSRLFRKLAQPLLEEFDQLSLTHVGADNEPDQERNKATRVLSVTVGSDRPLGSTESLVLNYPNLQSLHIYSERRLYYYINVSPFASLSCKQFPTLNLVQD